MALYNVVHDFVDYCRLKFNHQFRPKAADRHKRHEAKVYRVQSQVKQWAALVIINVITQNGFIELLIAHIIN